MKRLRNYGIYNLPSSQRSLVLISTGNDTFFLYDSEHGTRLPPRFSIADNGQIINWFKDFPVWTVDDLIDTGETYKN